MSIHTLSLVVTDQTLDAPALRAAAGIALGWDAHLDVRCLGISPIGLEADLGLGGLGLGGSTGAIVAAGLLEADQRAATLAAWVRDALPAGIRASVEPVAAQLPGLGPAVARAARFCDLAVAAKPYELGWTPLSPLVVEALLFGTGAPLLVVPPRDFDWGGPFQRVVLGWDDSDAAMRAARAALPLHAPGARVDVAVVDPPTREDGRTDPGEGLALWLARHEFDVEVSVLTRSLPRVADVLARLALDREAEALVMGGYGHSPFREAILGGPTRTLLKEAELPLVLAH